jgi:hypothetical protein
MEESATYQVILSRGERQGALREARKALLLLGKERFGAPGTKVAAAVEALDELERLEQLYVGVLHVSSWQELLRLPDPRRTRRTPPPRNHPRKKSS